MPKIGMRMVKSAIAVWICFMIHIIRGLVGPEALGGILASSTPFYAAIAAILCMQPYAKNSVTVALNRCVGTLIGGICGMLVLVLIRHAAVLQKPMVEYLLLSLCILPLIYITLLVKKTSASYITCVVFLSITVTHGGDGSPYAFAVSRMIDTLVGIGVSLGVNAFRLPHKKNTDTLFVSDLDGTLMAKSGAISTYAKVRLNRMLEQGLRFTVATARTPATLREILDGVDINLPLIVMNGSALYDAKHNSYLRVKTIPYDIAVKILAVFEKFEANCFAHTIVHDVLHIYYSGLRHPVERAFYDERKHLPLKAYLCGPLPEGREVVYFTAMDRLERIQAIYEALEAMPEGQAFHATYYSDVYHPGYYFLEVYHRSASKKNAIKELLEISPSEKVVVFGDNHNDLPMIEIAQESYAVANGAEVFRRKATAVIGTNESEAVVKTIVRLFYNRKPKIVSSQSPSQL